MVVSRKPKQHIVHVGSPPTRSNRSNEKRSARTRVAKLPNDKKEDRDGRDSCDRAGASSQVIEKRDTLEAIDELAASLAEMNYDFETGSFFDENSTYTRQDRYGIQGGEDDDGSWSSSQAFHGLPDGGSFQMNGNPMSFDELRLLPEYKDAQTPHEEVFRGQQPSKINSNEKVHKDRDNEQYFASEKQDEDKNTKVRNKKGKGGKKIHNEKQTLVPPTSTTSPSGRRKRGSYFTSRARKIEANKGGFEVTFSNQQTQAKDDERSILSKASKSIKSSIAGKSMTSSEHRRRLASTLCVNQLAGRRPSRTISEEGEVSKDHSENKGFFKSKKKDKGTEEEPLADAQPIESVGGLDIMSLGNDATIFSSNFTKKYNLNNIFPDEVSEMTDYDQLDAEVKQLRRFLEKRERRKT